jgi:hypothetical protein
LVKSPPHFGLLLLLLCPLGFDNDEILVGIKDVFFVVDTGQLVYLVTVVNCIASFLAF